MKRLLLISLLGIGSASASAQIPEDFNTSCATASFPAGGWQCYNSITTPASGLNGRWICTSTNGRPAATGGPATPGMLCSGVYSAAYHLDTSYFISPILNFTSAAFPGGKVYMRFDSRKQNIILGGKLAAGTRDTLTSFTDTIQALTENPLFGDADSSDWVTHEVNLSNHIDQGNFYFAFRYTSTAASGTAWYVDNIYLTPVALGLDNVTTNRRELPVTVLGAASSSRIELAYTTLNPGTYRIAIYDMMGREVYDNEMEARAGTASYIIDGLSLRPGMYCVKIGNENTYGTTKLMIQ